MFDSKSMTKGKKGEEAVFNWLLENGYDVLDVRDDNDYRKKDIDFIASKGGQFITIEVKAQSNVAYDRKFNIEDVLNISTGLEGWIHKCKAEYLCIYSHGELFIVKTEEMLDYIKETPTLEKRLIEDPIIEDSIAIVQMVPAFKYKATGRYFRYIERI